MTTQERAPTLARANFLVVNVSTVRPSGFCIRWDDLQLLLPVSPSRPGARGHEDVGTLIARLIISGRAEVQPFAVARDRRAVLCKCRRVNVRPQKLWRGPWLEDARTRRRVDLGRAAAAS